MVLRELLGPAAGPEEELDEQRVHDRYLIGMLAPSKTQTNPEELDELADAEEGGPGEGTEDADTMQTVSYSPASLGMSFCVDVETTTLLVAARWGHYRRDDSESLKNQRGTPKKVWKRTPRGGTPHSIQLREGHLPYWQPEPEELPEVYVRGIARRNHDT